MSTQKRQYKIVKGNQFERTFREMLKDSNIFYFMSIDTTGLFTDTFTPEPIQIVVRKCAYENGVMNKLGTFTSFIKPECKIPEHITELNHITNEDVDNAPRVNAVFTRLYELMEPHANIIGYNMDGFLIPLIKLCGLQTGLMFYDAKYIDLRDLAESVMYLDKNNGGYRMSNVLNYLGKGDMPTGNAVDNVIAYEYLFNTLYPLVPTGTDQAYLTEERFWMKSYRCKYLYLQTTRGRISINASNFYIQEETPGTFDAIDIENVVKQLTDRHGGIPIWEICRAYEKRAKAVNK